MKTLKLTQPHRHDGRDYAAGDILTVPAEIAEQLLKLGRATAAPEPKPGSPTAAAN